MTSRGPESGTRPANARTRRRLERARARRRAAGADHAVVIAYDGAAFSGYARQPGRDTVEARLRDALEAVAPGLRRMAVGGRTDRGVSAFRQVVSFRSDHPVAPDAIAGAVEESAPGRLTCLSAQTAPRGFHAQFWAIERRYAYLHPAGEEELALVAPLDALLRRLVGERSFFAFARETPPGRSPRRRVHAASCRLGHIEDRPLLVFELAASGFLRRMVRVVVATALEAARAGAPADTLARLADAEDRAGTAPPAPPEPLRLERIVYARWTPVGA
jgi:tRNA pseudouridine38-40 synthase